MRSSGKRFAHIKIRRSTGISRPKVSHKSFKNAWNNAVSDLVKYQASSFLLAVLYGCSDCNGIRTRHGRTTMGIYYNVKYKYTIRNEEVYRAGKRAENEKQMIKIMM